MDNIISFGFTLHKHTNRPSLISGFVTYSRISSLRKFTLLRLGDREMITSSTDGFTALNDQIFTSGDYIGPLHFDYEARPSYSYVS